MNISYESKVALVTGAGSGLGLATAKAFAESGASVVLADWNEEAVRSAAKGLAAQGHKALAIHCDVADDVQVEAMVEQTVATFGRLDAAYNNAGVQNVLAETVDYPREDYDRVMAINLRGVWSCMKFASSLVVGQAIAADGGYTVRRRLKLMKPYIICHMLSSVDGKIDSNALDAVIAEGEYEATGAKLEGDAWIWVARRCSSTLRRMSRSSQPRTRRRGRSPSSSLAERILKRSL